MDKLFFAYPKISAWKEQCWKCKKTFLRESLIRVYHLTPEGQVPEKTFYICFDCKKKIVGKYDNTIY